MKAWQVSRFGEPAEVLVNCLLDDPVPTDSEVLIKVDAVGLNFLDVMTCRGMYPINPELPFIPCAELVGRVCGLGSKSALSLGQRVIALQPRALGSLAELSTVPAQFVYPVSENIPSYDAAALLVTYQTAYFAMQKAKLKQGENLLIHAGAGGVGTAAIQLGLALGAKVIATASNPRKLEVCREEGADVVIDYKKDDIVSTVKAATDGKGADVILDQIGGEVFNKSLECLALDGRILPIGWASGKEPEVMMSNLVMKNHSVIGLSWGSTYPRDKRDEVLGAHECIQKLYKQGKVKPHISEVTRFNNAPRLLQRLGDGMTVGKLIVTIDD